MRVLRHVCLAAVLGVLASPARAATQCFLEINYVVYDDLVVPNGTMCTINGGTIVGNVTLEPGNNPTVFTFESGVITGNLVATGVNNSSVVVNLGTVMGDVEVGGQGLVGGIGGRVGGRVTVVGDVAVWHVTATIGRDVVVRNVRLQDNANSLGVVGIQLNGATVYGNVLVQGNVVTPRNPNQLAFFGLYPIGVVGSRITGNLTLSGNAVPDLRVIFNNVQSAHPIVTGGNIIAGSADCRRNQPAVYREPGLLPASIIVGKNVGGLCQ